MRQRAAPSFHIAARQGREPARRGGVPPEEADRLADQYGDRFRPNKLLRDMAAKNESFYERFGAKEKKAA